MMNNRILISVIVPIYKVENFIQRCVTTLLEQDMEGVEYIFVDDATPDRSIEILEQVIKKYPQKLPLIRIVRHSVNKGLPAARNTGLEYARGEYIYHCDSDDYVEKNMLSDLYAAAHANDADIVWCDWMLTFEKNERYMKQPCFTTSVDAVKAMLSGAMKFNVWNKLVRHSLYIDNNISFPSGYGMGEDMTMIRLFANANRIAYVNKAFYHYVQQNSGAFSKTYSQRHLDELKHNVDSLINYLQKIYGDSLRCEYAFLKLDVKFPFLISSDSRKYQLWKEWYPEANPFILLNKSISVRSRYLQWFAFKNQFWLVWLYYQVVHRFIYGIVYR